MSALEIREAVEADNAALLALTRATPMPGTISLRIDRDPDFFGLPRLRGETKVIVAAQGDEVAGCISATLTTAFISGRPETVGYLGDLKVDPRFAGNRLMPRLLGNALAHFQSRKVDLVLSVVADGNERVVRFFDDGRGLAPSADAGRFVVDGLLATPFAPRALDYRIDRVEAADLPEVTALLDRFHRAREFAPALADGEPAGDSPAFVARAGGEIVATLTLFDPQCVKKSVLVGAPALLRGALALVALATRALPGFAVPRIGEPIPMLYARRVACADGHQAALASLLRHARVHAFRQRRTFVALGLHERDPLRSAVRGIPRLTFSTRAFVSSLESSSRLHEIASRVPYEDFALV